MFTSLILLCNVAGKKVINCERASVILFILILTAASCNQTETAPTLVPTVENPALIATSSPTFPATIKAVEPTAVDPTALKPTVAQLTLAPTDTPTPVVSTREPTALPPSGVTITFPTRGSEFQLGEELITGGRARLDATEFISVSLLSATGIVLDQARAEINDFSNWQANLSIPQWVSGPAFLLALVSDQENVIKNSDELAIELRISDETVGRAIDLFRPKIGDHAISGYYLLFDGWVQQPLSNLVTVSLWHEDCQQMAAFESFRLSGSGNWWGLLFVPTNLSGPVCASARFGSPGESDWRESQTMIEVLDGAHSQTNAVVIAIPRIDAAVESGRSETIKGVAYNAPDRLVNVTVLLNNGRLLTEGVTGADRYGYWELSLFIPADAAGAAQIFASIGSRGNENYYEISSPITIVP